MGSEPQNATRLIVCNTGPLLHLWQIRRQHLLNYLGRICIPVEVADEFSLLTDETSIGISVDTLRAEGHYAKQAEKWVAARYLHLGEAMAIALARQLQCTWFLTDDTKARLFAETLGIEVHGSLGVVIACASLGFIQPEEAHEVVVRLSRESSLWVSERVLDRAIEALKQLEP
ncbi:MAG: hypothetical protein K6U75_08355 [Firmicutes bacterium]|nr:hypothetical protein [Bacillota bacterium]